MPGLGFSSEIILIFIVALIVFGPKRLPDIAKSLGRAVNEFKRSMNEVKRQIEAEVGTESIKEDLLRQQREIQQKLAGLNPTEQAPVPANIEKIETTEFADSGQAAVNKASAAAAKANLEEAPAGQAEGEKAGSDARAEDKAVAAPSPERPKKEDA